MAKDKGKATKKTEAEKADAKKDQQSDALKKAQEARAKKSAERREANKKLVASIGKKLVKLGFTEVEKSAQVVYHREDKDRIWLFKNGSMAYLVRDDVLGKDQVDGKTVIVLDEAEAKKRHLGRIRCIVKNLALLEEAVDEYPEPMPIEEKPAKKAAKKKEEEAEEEEADTSDDDLEDEEDEEEDDDDLEDEEDDEEDDDEDEEDLD